jgi:hypothetical protein
VNPTRAAVAARYSKVHGMEKAIQLATEEVSSFLREGATYDESFEPYVVPLLSTLGSN